MDATVAIAPDDLKSDFTAINQNADILIRGVGRPKLIYVGMNKHYCSTLPVKF